MEGRELWRETHEDEQQYHELSQRHGQLANGKKRDDREDAHRAGVKPQLVRAIGARPAQAQLALPARDDLEKPVPGKLYDPNVDATLEQVARLSGRVTTFGGFLDSSLDRLSDMVVFVGLIVFYARDTQYHSTLNVFLAGAALMGSVMVSYASARAESLIPKCDVGFLRRPERVVLFIIGGLTTHPGSTSPFLNRMPAVLWVLAVGSYWTFAHRMYHTWREVKKADAARELTAKASIAASNAPSELRQAPTLAHKTG